MASKHALPSEKMAVAHSACVPCACADVMGKLHVPYAEPVSGPVSAHAQGLCLCLCTFMCICTCMCRVHGPLRLVVRIPVSCRLCVVVVHTPVSCRLCAVIVRTPVSCPLCAVIMRTPVSSDFELFWLGSRSHHVVHHSTQTEKRRS